MLEKEGLIELNLGLDYDDTIAETTPAMKAVFEWQYPGVFPSEFFEGRMPDPQEYPDLSTLYRQYSAARWGHLREVSYISGIPPCEGVTEALSILDNFFTISLITARWIDQADCVEQYLEKQDWLKYISGMHFRNIETQDQLVAKAQAASLAGISYMAEDHGPLATYFAENGIRVVLIDRPWNRGVKNAPNIRRYRELVDFARDIKLHKDPEALFAEHAASLADEANIYKVHEVSKIRIF